MAPVMKDSGIEWVKEIPVMWNVRPIYIYFEERNNKNIFLQEKNLLSLSYGKIIRKNINATEGLLPASFSTYNIVDPGDIVIRPTDLQNDKRSLRTGLVTEKGIITSAYICLAPKKAIKSSFVHYLLHSYDVQKVFYNMGNGVRLGLNYKELSKLLVVSPPSIREQQKIASYLDNRCSEIDALTADIEKQIEILQEYKKSVITEAVTKGLDPNVEMKDSGVEWIGFTPRKWKLVRVKHVLYEVDKRSKTGEEEPLSMSQVYGIIPSSMISVANPASSFVGAKIVSENDLVLNKLKAHLGVFAVSNYHGLVSPDYAVYRSREPVTAQFLQYLFRTPCCITEFRKYINGVGAGLSRLYTSDLFRIKISLPDSGEQMAIVNYLNEKCSKINDLIDDKTKQITSLRSYKCSVIYEYITGKKTTLSQTQE